MQACPRSLQTKRDKAPGDDIHNLNPIAAHITSQSMPYMYCGITSFEWRGFARTRVRTHVMPHRQRRQHVDTMWIATAAL